MRRLAALMAAALLLAGCGFRPLYGTASIPEGAANAFAAVRIEPIAATNDSDRIGWLVAGALDVALHKPGLSVDAKHVLKVSLTDERRGLAIQDDASITRYNYRLSAEWTLSALGAETALAQGRAETTASYNVVDSQYGTLVARRDAEDRAAREIAEQIKLKVAVALQSRQALRPAGEAIR
jgi:LPS-assembly lipoprotein